MDRMALVWYFVWHTCGKGVEHAEKKINHAFAQSRSLFCFLLTTSGYISSLTLQLDLPR